MRITNNFKIQKNIVKKLKIRDVLQKKVPFVGMKLWALALDDILDKVSHLAPLYLQNPPKHGHPK